MSQPDVVLSDTWYRYGGGIVKEGRLSCTGCVELLRTGHITVDFDDPIQCTCGKKAVLNGCIGDRDLTLVVDESSIESSSTMVKKRQLAKEGDALCLGSSTKLLTLP